ncbi:hypothetical protein LCI18_013336 [Fusarium solani-melongenae]|uniref:Uncharacterized protein n=1 Tax=Fusarium solani subsp. cucurbitae TaxID=2747967 RepID=A0ACD3ZMG7_FUSSC|nr:hypothetical protein LCI18_013336 [Fusarium solani-melongenae]
MSGLESHTAGSRGRSASAPPTILPRNGLVLESIRNDLGQSVATGFRNVQSGTTDNVIAASDALGNDAIAFQGSEHTVCAALERAIELASFTKDTQIARFLFVARPSMMAKSPDELQELNLSRVARNPVVQSDAQGVSNMAEDNLDPQLPATNVPAAERPRVKGLEKLDESDED